MIQNLSPNMTLPDVRIDCFLFLTPEEMQESRLGALKDLGTINVLHIKATGDNFTKKHLQTYLGQGLIVNGSDKVGGSEIVVLLILCSEKPSNILENDVFQFEPSSDEEWVYKNKHKWFFPVRILVLNDIDLTDENLPTYFPFVPFITARKKFLEFFPKIGDLNISEVWKFFCDLFASKANPRYWEVTKMTFWLTADDIQHALEHVRQEEIPAVFDRMLSRIPPEQRLDSLDKMKDFIPKGQLKEWARKILNGSE